MIALLNGGISSHLRFVFPFACPHRHHTFKKTGHKKIDLTEVGPRFDMKLYQLKLGQYMRFNWSL